MEMRKTENGQTTTTKSVEEIQATIMRLVKNVGNRKKQLRLLKVIRERWISHSDFHAKVGTDEFSIVKTESGEEFPMPQMPELIDDVLFNGTTSLDQKMRDAGLLQESHRQDAFNRGLVPEERLGSNPSIHPVHYYGEKDVDFGRLGSKRAEIRHKIDDMKKRDAVLFEKKIELDAKLDGQIFRDDAAHLHQWLRGPFVLQRPDQAAMHRCMEELRLVPAYGQGTSADDFKISGLRVDTMQMHSLLIEHDWASVHDFSDALNEHGSKPEWKFPYESQCFELHISGLRVCCFATMQQQMAAFITMRTKERRWIFDKHWLTFEYDGPKPLSGYPLSGGIDLSAIRKLVFDQVRACSIMLDAQVAETIPARAPYKSNRPPKIAGDLPEISYHVVSLAKRKRAAALPPDEIHTPGRRKRLHFRRGHWRHFTERKTWINWMLVGDPDLGFVEKDYRL